MANRYGVEVRQVISAEFDIIADNVEEAREKASEFYYDNDEYQLKDNPEIDLYDLGPADEDEV